MKYIFVLEGLNCAHCAEKIMADIRNMPGIESAELDFMSKRATVFSSIQNQDALTADIEKIVHSYEPDVLVRMDNAQTKNKANKKAAFSKTILIRLAVGAALFIIGLCLNNMYSLYVYLAAYVVTGIDVLYKAIRGIFNGHLLDENFLMSIATIGAFIVGEYPEGAAVMLFYQLGELFSDYAVEKSRKSVEALMDIKPEKANLVCANGVVPTDPSFVQVGDTLLVKPGERIPVDGIIISKSAVLDMSALTGESVPVSANYGDSVLSGSINKASVFKMRAEKTYENSTVAKILDLMQNAAAKKSSSEKFISKFARVYTPIVVALAVLIAILPPLIIPGNTFNDWVYRALNFLVVSCPCALVISIPLSFFGSMGGASRAGILVKGGIALEKLAKAETIVFDKTGTLTEGKFRVSSIYVNGASENELIETAAYAERYSNHPIALSILEHYGKSIDEERISDYTEIAGLGISAKIDGKTVLAGRSALMKENNINYTENSENGTIVYIAKNGKFMGSIAVNDNIKSSSERAIYTLKKSGIKTCILTGDRKDSGMSVAKKLGIDTAYTELLPADKVDKIEEIIKTANGSVAFVGDGMNDAPVLARADVGIAMGSIGSDAAVEAADIVIMDDNIEKIPSAVRISKKTMRIVHENIAFALIVKFGVLILAALGIATMWEAVFADVGVAALAILNSLRGLSKNF